MGDKKNLLMLFRNELHESVETYQKSMEMQKEFIEDSPGPMQSRYDSAMVEGQWLLSSMQKNRDTLLKALACLDALLEKDEEACETVREGALIVLRQKENGRKNGYLLLEASGGGGASVLYNGEKYMVITAESPLGKALMGKKAGDEVELRTSRLTRYAVESVS